MTQTLLVAKTGSVLYMADALEKQGPMTEQGATAGLVTYLARARDDDGSPKYRVLYLGKLKGTLPEGAVHLDPDLKNVGEWTTVAESRKIVQDLVDQARPYEPTAFVNVSGSSPSWYTLDNPRGSSVMVCAQRYVAPALGTAAALKLPRVVLNADVRCYPREGEMNFDPAVVPVALFSQVTREWERTVMGERWRAREVACGMENWHTVGREPPDLSPTRPLPLASLTLSHCHVGSGFGKFARRIAEGRERAWRRTFLEPRDVRPELLRLGAAVYGEGWEHSSCYDAALMKGEARPADVMGLVSQSCSGPVVTPWGDDPYVTSKVRYLCWGGCVPLMFGRGEWEPHMGDGVGKYVALDDEKLRYRDSEEFLHLTREYARDDRLREHTAASLEAATSPQFGALERCLEALSRGFRADTDEWLEEYGGYRHAGSKRG
jgi:hypothetical protein